MKRALLGGAVILSVGAVSFGCSGGGSSGGGSFLDPTAPVQSATWDAYYTANPAVQGDAVTALTGVPSGHLLVGQSAAQVYRVDSNSLAALESTFGAGVTSLADMNSSVFAGTGDPLFRADSSTPGQVLQRADDGTWTVALDYTDHDLVVAAIGSHLYSFASPAAPDASNPTRASIMIDGNWLRDIASLGSAVITAAASYEGEMWAGGTDGGALLVHGLLSRGPASGFTVASLPITVDPVVEVAVVTDLFAIDSDLYVAVLCVDAANTDVITRGEVFFTSDSQTWYSVGSFVDDGPRSLGWHEGSLHVGTASGALQVYDFGQLADVEPQILTNMGVHSIASVDSNTLLVGVAGNSGAEVLRRTLTAPANPDPVAVIEPAPLPGTGTGTPGTPTPTTPAALSYLGGVKPILAGQCAVCHADVNNAASQSFPLSAGLVDDQADYAQVLDRVKVGSGINGSLLLRKSTNRSPHGGGQALVSGSAQHQTIVDWLANGGAFQ